MTTWGNPQRIVSQGGGFHALFRGGNEGSACCLTDSEPRNTLQFPSVMPRTVGAFQPRHTPTSARGARVKHQRANYQRTV